MSYNINSLPSKPDISKIYLLDTNIWFFLLTNFYKKTDKIQSEYEEFFHKLCKAGKSIPKIKLPSFIFSETINRYLRSISMEMYALKKNEQELMKKNKTEYYKNHYKKSSEYNLDYNLLCDNIKNYSMFYDLINDSFDTIFDKNSLQEAVVGELDFPDYLLYKIALTNNYTIVTHDSDFFVENVEIFTLNKSLLEKDHSS